MELCLKYSRLFFSGHGVERVHDMRVTREMSMRGNTPRRQLHVARLTHGATASI